MLRDAAPFAEALLVFWTAAVEPELEHCMEDEDFDGVAYAAALASRELGVPAARAFLSVVAASDLEVAPEVEARFDELAALTDNPPSLGVDQERKNGTQATTGELLSRIGELRADGRQLAERVRAAADSLADGRPAEPIELAADNWSTEVRALLEEADDFCEANDLDELEAKLHIVTAEMSKRNEAARSALQTIELLQSQGVDEMVTQLLERLGFSSVQEVRHLAGLPADGQALDSRMIEEPGTPIAAGDLTAARRPSDGPDRVGEEERFAAGLIDPSATGPSGDDIVNHDSLAPAPDALVGTEVADDLHTPEDQQTEASQDETRASAMMKDDAAAASPSVSPSAPEASDPGSSPETDHFVAPAEPPDLNRPPDFPWDEGTPPLIAQLILLDRRALAYHVAVAAGETRTRQGLLKLACAAAHCTPEALELALSQLVPSEAEIENLDANEVRTLLASLLRVGLTLGYAPIGLGSLVDRAELADTGLAHVTKLLAELAQRGYRRGSEAKADGEEDLATRWTKLGAEAQALAGVLSRKTTKYHRSSRVLHYLARKTEPVGHALLTAAALTERGVDSASDDQWPELEETAKQLLDDGDRDHLIDKADERVSSSHQRRNPITGGSRTQLHDSLSQVGTLITRLLAVRRAILAVEDLGSIASKHDLSRALADAPMTPAAHTVGEAELVSLLTWLRADPTPPQSESLAAELDRGLGDLFELTRDADGRPTRAPTGDEIQSLLTGRTAEEVITGYLDRGNIAAARAYIEAHGLEGENDDQILRATNTARAAHQAAISDADRVAARLRALGEDDSALLVTEQIDAHRQPPRPDRFDLVIEPLQMITATAEQDLGVVRQRLRDATAAVDAPDESKSRVLERIGRGDEALAVEYLTYLQDGQPLPDVEQSHGDDFRDFYPLIVEAAAAAQAEGQDPIIAARRARSVTGEPSEQLGKGLEAWRTVKVDKRGDAAQFRWSVAQVLRMVGLVPPTEGWLKPISRAAERSGFATFRVKATPVDHSYVPQLGTEAHGSYDVTFVWATVSPGRLLDFIDDKYINRPNVIFYFGVLDVEERRRLRNETQPGRGKGFSPLIIDEAVVGWLSTLREPGWRFTQRVTLPFTTINPYTPFAGGEVPDEVFVGREEERRRIESPTGSMFVYGGRQLGKSALLRRVERMFTDRVSESAGGYPRVGNVALYIDLKAQGIGESQKPAALWPLLGERLKALGVIPAKERTSSSKEVAGQITRWLNEDSSNRLLLLLDEADNFMTADANAGAPSAAGAFPVLQALKGVMESSQRRFKPIFAGLHQIQRFHDMSNTPVAHGGEDILIGPLKNSDAYSLVVDPMNALGYQFESPESVWRLLLVTNYQASLVQIVCEALVKHVQGRQLPGGNEVRIAITEKDVQDVCDKQSVRDLIELRFRWTINLDSRYRVIALVVALESIDDGPGLTLTVDEMREQCETYWPAGFDPVELSRKEFERYLEEMVGLRVLRRHEGRYGLRSPYIIQMLGSRASLEHELLECAQHLERPLEYNPTMTRQIIGDSTQVWSPRSPLTDNDLAVLLTASPESSVQIVVGTEALGVDRVARVLAEAARVNGIEVVSTDIADAFIMDRRQFNKRTHAILDVSRAQTSLDLGAIIASLHGRHNLTATVVVGPRTVADLAPLMVPVHKLRRWSVTGLRAWYDSPFEELADREALFNATSGWPKLVEEVMFSYAKGKSPGDALTALTKRLVVSGEAKKFLAQCAIDPVVAQTWSDWFVTRNDDGAVLDSEPASANDLTDVLGRSAYPVLEQLEKLDVVTQHGDFWVLDRVVASATIEASK
jgi:hypothetical protein